MQAELITEAVRYCYVDSRYNLVYLYGERLEASEMNHG